MSSISLVLLVKLVESHGIKYIKYSFKGKFSIIIDIKILE